MRRMKAYAYDWLAWLAFLAAALVALWQCETSLVDQGVASGGPMENAAAFPRVIAWLMVGLSALNGLRIVTGRLAQVSPVASTPTTHIALWCSIAFVLFLLLLRPVGYHLATPVLLLVVLRLLGVGWMAGVAGALVMSVSVAAVFEGLLNVVLPVGYFHITLFG